MSTTSTSPRISLDNVTVGYGRQVVQSGISVEIEDREIFAIVGQRLGQEHAVEDHDRSAAAAGRAHSVRPQDSGGAHAGRAAAIRSIVSERARWWTSMSVIENVTMPMELQGDASSSSARPGPRAVQACAGRAGRRRGPLPGEPEWGHAQARRAARAIALDPSVLFLDEPSADWIPLTSRRLDELVLTLRDGLGITVVLVTHELQSLYSIADRMLFLDGEAHRPVALGHPAGAGKIGRQPQGARFSGTTGDGAFCSQRGGNMTKPSTTLIGAFVLGAIALIVAAVLFFGSGQFAEKRSRRRASSMVRWPDCASVRRSRFAACASAKSNRWASASTRQRQLHHSGQHGAVARNLQSLWRRHAARGREADSRPGAARPRRAAGAGELRYQVAGRGRRPSPRRPGLAPGEPTSVPEVPTVPSGLETFTKKLEEVDIAATLQAVERAFTSVNTILNSPEAKQTIMTCRRYTCTQAHARHDRSRGDQVLGHRPRGHCDHFSGSA